MPHVGCLTHINKDIFTAKYIVKNIVKYDSVFKDYPFADKSHSHWLEKR